MTLGVVDKEGKCSCFLCDWKSADPRREQAKYLMMQHLIDQHGRSMMSCETTRGTTKIVGVQWR